MKSILFVLLSLFSAAEAQEKPSPIDVQSYALELAYGLQDSSVSGTVRISFRSMKESGAVEFDARDIDITDVSEEGNPLGFLYDRIKIRLLPEKSYRKNSLHTVSISYRASSSKGIKILPDQIYTAYHTANWMPCNFNPGDKAKFALDLSVDWSYEVVAGNGSLQQSRILHTRLEQSCWRNDRELPAYAMGFAAGEFKVLIKSLNGTEFRAFYNSHSEAEIEKALAGIGEVKSFFEEVSGTNYPGPHYSYVFVKGKAAQEAGNFCLIGEEYLDEVLNEPMENWLLIHELSHEWWGNSITCSGWENFWLNEGFAQFMTAAAKERLFGRDEYEREIWLSMRRYERFREAGKDRPLEYRRPVPEDSAGGGLVYNKGCLVLHLLRNMLGEKDFWKGVGIYSGENYGKSVSGKDLQQAMERAGGRDLEAFFNDYVYGEKALPLPASRSYGESELPDRIISGKDLFERIYAMEQMPAVLRTKDDKVLMQKFIEVLKERAEKDPSRLVRQIAGEMLKKY